MSSPEQIAPLNYTSTYEHGVDEKRRVQIPSKWRPKQAGMEFTMIQWPKGVGGAFYLLVLPPSQVQELLEEIKRKQRDKEINADQATAMRRIVFGQAQTVKLDTAGRITLPEQMAKLAEIPSESTAVLVGTGERFEIWNQERHAAKRAEDKALEEDALKLFSL